ncbi:MAG TPA: tripartite tricarboxylate transporter TctB family protein [Candidatus Methylomirabilis sp.]|nr:tripartite tricarboxylate transporter TctB family protein [Candidatus Methylomirabilis sp.]
MRLRTIESALLAVVALTAVGEGLRIIFGYTTRLRAFEAGGYLVLIGLLLAGVTILYWRREPEARWEVGQGGRWVMIAMLILVAYTLLLPVLGYLLSTTLVFIVYLRAFSTYRWPFILGFSCTVGVGSTWAWDQLAIMLPAGPLPWP